MVAPMWRLLTSTTAAVLVAAAPATAAVPTLSIDAARAIPDGKKLDVRLAAGSYRGRAGIELRGTSSIRTPKKSYALELRDSRGDDRDARLLGLPAESDFVLLSAHDDASLIRDVVGFDAARRLGRYAPRTRFVELRLDGRARGVYVLSERLELGRRRIAVDRKGPAGGYLLELSSPGDPKEPGDDGIRLPASGLPLFNHDPERNDLDAAERRFIDGFASQADRALVHGGDWRRFIDEPAAVDFFLLQELLGNADAFHRSTFMSKGARGGLVLGPVWDLDLTLGGPSPIAGAQGWKHAGRPWGDALARDRAFAAKVAARWRAVRGGLVGGIAADIRRRAAELEGAAQRNFTRWPAPRPWGDELAATQAWLTARAAWLDANVDRLRQP
jgi:hypothetical protein